MHQSEFVRFKAVMVGMGKVHKTDIDSPMLDAYWLALRDWSLEDFEMAAAHLLQTFDWMPKPSNFTALRKAGRATAGEAWTIARNACGSCREVTRAGANYGTGGTCGDPLIDRAVQALGGYRAIAMSASDKLHFLEQRFAEHYAELQAVEDVRTAVPQVAHSGIRTALKGPTSSRDLLGRIGAGDSGAPRPQ